MSVLLSIAAWCYTPSAVVLDVVFISVRKTSIIFCPHPSGKLTVILAMYVIFCACARICDCVRVCVAVDCFCITLSSTLELTHCALVACDFE